MCVCVYVYIYCLDLVRISPSCKERFPQAAEGKKHTCGSLIWILRWQTLLYMRQSNPEQNHVKPGSCSSAKSLHITWEAASGCSCTHIQFITLGTQRHLSQYVEHHNCNKLKMDLWSVMKRWTTSDALLIKWTWSLSGRWCTHGEVLGKKTPAV